MKKLVDRIENNAKIDKCLNTLRDCCNIVKEWENDVDEFHSDAYYLIKISDLLDNLNKEI